MEQPCQELPGGQPQQERARQPQEQHWFPACPSCSASSSTGLVDADLLTRMKSRPRWGKKQKAVTELVAGPDSPANVP